MSFGCYAGKVCGGDLLIVGGTFETRAGFHGWSRVIMAQIGRLNTRGMICLHFILAWKDPESLPYVPVGCGYICVFSN